MDIFLKERSYTCIHKFLRTWSWCFEQRSSCPHIHGQSSSTSWVESNLFHASLPQCE